MPRQNRAWNRTPPSAYQPTEDVLVKPIPIGGFEGMDKHSPLPTMSRQAFRLVQNMAIRDGAWQTRDGTDTIGAAAGADLLYACDVRLTDGRYFIVRWRTNGVDVYENGVWTPAAGAWSGLKTWPFAITGWTDRLLFTAGVGRVYELTFGPHTVTELSESPLQVIHLTTFNGRVVASEAGPSVHWSAKFDHTDWDGLGSGYEDLLSAPGGRPDQQTAVVPITDEIAYCIRSSSIWQMANTGDFDSPFAFTLNWSHAGSKLPQTVVQIMRGVMCVGDAGQVWRITPQGPEDISKRVAIDFKIEQGYLGQAAAAYDVRFDEYRVVIPGPNSLTSQKVMRYSMSNNSWSEDIYPFPIKHFSYTKFAKILTVDELSGPVDNFVGQADDLGVGMRHPGCIYAMGGAGRLVVRDDEGRTDLDLKDVSFSGGRVASGFRMESGDVSVGDPIYRQEFTELICWYEARKATTLNFDYSYDGGVAWNMASQITVPTTGPRAKPFSVMRTADREHQQFAVSCEAAPHLRLVSFQAMMRQGARIVDAS